MNEDKVMMELSFEDVLRLDDLIFGLILLRHGSIETKDCLQINTRLLLYASHFDNFNDLKNWVSEMQEKIYQVKKKAIADRTDPILP